MRPASSARRRPRADRTVTGRVLARLRRTLVTALVLVVGFSGVDAAFALWQDRAAASGGTVTTGSASLEAQWTHGLEESTWQNLLPGESAQQQLTLDNTGDVPLALTAQLATPADGFEIRLATGADGRELSAPELSLPVLGTDSRPLTAVGSPSAAVVLAPGQSIDVTVDITAAPQLAPGAEIDLEITLDGRQVR